MSIEVLLPGAPEEQIRQADVMVCGDRPDGPRETWEPERLREAEEGECAKCKAPVIWQSDVPLSLDKRLCIKCATAMVIDKAVESLAAKLDGDDNGDPMPDLPEAELALARAFMDMPPIPKPGDATYDAFAEGTAFALSIMLIVFGAEQRKGSLADLSKADQAKLANAFTYVDAAVEAALGRPDEDEDETPEVAS